MEKWRNGFKVKCYLWMNKLWTNKVTLLLSLCIFLNCMLLLGVFGVLSTLESCLYKCEFIRNIIVSLKSLYHAKSENGFNFTHIVTSLGVLIGLLILHLRNHEMNKQTSAMNEQRESQYKIFNEDKQFSNFLEATKLLTDKDSTTEAKIAAMFSLADVAQDHPKHLDRIIQVLNKELIPLIKAIDGNDDFNKFTCVVKEKEITTKWLVPRKEIKSFTYTRNKIVSYRKGQINRENIKSWQHKGNEAEKIVSVALYVIRKIILDLKDHHSNFDFSNTIFFDIDVEFDKKVIESKFIRKNNKRVENAIFLDCNLEEVNFSETQFHFCEFINCNLSNANFSGANLWGTSFKSCNLDKIKFNEAKCEGLELIHCQKLTLDQLNQMFPEESNSLKNKESPDKKYPIIIDKDTLEKNTENLSYEDSSGKNKTLDAKDFFATPKEYIQWKNK